MSVPVPSQFVLYTYTYQTKVSIKIKSRNCINEVFQCPENDHYSNAGKNLYVLL